jgi:hypothetical protein
MSVVVARLLKWGRPTVHRPAYSPAHVDLPVGRIVTRPGPNRSQIIVGKVESVRATPAGLEASIRLKDNAEGVETAAEMADGYLPAVEVHLQPLTKDPATFKPQARVLGLTLSTIADPSGDDGRILSVDGVRTPSPDPEALDAKPVKPVKPHCRRGVAHRGRPRLVAVGERRRLSTPRPPHAERRWRHGAVAPSPPIAVTPPARGSGSRHDLISPSRAATQRYAGRLAGLRHRRSPSRPEITVIRRLVARRATPTPRNCSRGRCSSWWANVG